MIKNLRWKYFVIFIVIGGSIWLSFPLREKIHLGLDLQGGMHLLLEVQAEKAVETILNRTVTDIRNNLENNEIDFEKVSASSEDKIKITLFHEDFLKDIRNAVRDYTFLREDEYDPENLVVTYKLDKQERKRIEENAVDQGLETIRNRIDQFGVVEPTIQRQGSRRILIQLPGISDIKRAKGLIGKTALLEFKLVDEENSLENALAGKIPEESKIYYQRNVDKETRIESKTPFLLKKQTVLTGDSLVTAEVRIDQSYNEPYVSITFDKPGARRFRQITRENVKKRLAIVLDNNIYSAPVIQEEIAGGQAQITGRFDIEEARDLAIVLRAGTLPAPVTILEERDVGPSLGKDSIEKGIKSIMIGGLLVVVFALMYYKLSGAIADLALFLNLIILLGALAYFGASLTLPGIAGIILTIGMAIDANILIFERIREELRIGKTIRAAVEMGFAKAFKTIIDANVTTIIAAIVLFQFGTGPIKGFAVTLSIGIIASMFTSLFVSRVIFDTTLSLRKVKKLSI